MDETYIFSLSHDMFMTALLIAAPAMIVGMLVGIAMAIFQAVTSVQEQTLAMVPKIAAVMITLFLLMPWSMRLLLRFSETVLSSLADAAH
jgi:flagellar biosynthetic protein FliQ